MRDVTPEEDAILRAALRASGKVVETAATRAAVAAARAQIVGWLRADAMESDASARAARQMGRDGLAVVNEQIAATTRLHADQIESSAPQRWAAEREQGP